MIELLMHCESEERPQDFMIENISDELCDLVLFDEIEEKQDEDRTYFSSNIYRIMDVNYREDLEENLKDEETFNLWVEYAKERYAEQAEKISLEERMAAAEAVIAELLNAETEEEKE